MTNLTVLSDAELDQLRVGIIAEQEKRMLLRTAPQQADQLARRVLAAEGVAQGEPWRQPTGAHDAYPQGWRVTHNGAEWESLVEACVWEPGVSAWRKIGTDGPAEWQPPTGAHDAYNTGDRVTYQGKVFESVIDGNTWSPTDYPAGWVEITD